MYALQKLVEAHEAAIRWLQADPDAISASAMRDCLNAMMETMEIEKCSHCGEVVEQSEIEIDLCEQCTRGAAERAEDRAADLLAINTRGR
jgi:hypothetical protein